MQAENMELEVKNRDADLQAVKAKCDHSDQYIENMLQQNDHLKTQIISLNAKVRTSSFEVKMTSQKPEYCL